MTPITWRHAAVAGCVLGVVYVLVPSRPVTDVLWLLVLAATCAAIAEGVRRHRPRSARSWWLLCGGFGLLLAANVLRLALPVLPAFYPVAVVAILAAYTLMVLAALGLVRAQAPGRDREGAIDGAIVMVALATVLSSTVMAPEAFTGTASPLEPVLMVVPPLLVAAIIAVTLRLLFGGSRCLPSAWLLVGGGAAGLTGNVVRMMLAAGGAYERGTWPDLFLLLACVSVAAGALHPSMAAISEPGCETSRRPTGARLAVLAVALLAAPGTLLASDPGADWAVPVLASLTLTLLVFWRLAALVFERETVRSQLHARALRQEALARIGRRALRDGDLEALFSEAAAITTELLDLRRCEVVTAPARSRAGRAAVVLPLGDDGDAALALAAERPGEWSDEDAAFLQAVANVLAGAVERHRTQELLRRRALHDPLTELPNRTKLRDHLGRALGRAAAEGRAVALLFVDLDGFKAVNDQLGHAAGDELLVAVARRLARAVRPADVLARLAGDEFVIVCEHSSRDDARTVAERVAAVLAEPFSLAGGHARLGASVGVALSEGPGDVDRLLSEADTAMYRAKERPGCSVAFFDDDLRQRASRRRRLEAALPGALTRGEFDLRYQPLAPLGGGGDPVGVEAVPRWRHPGEGLVEAAEFVPLAERSGAIVPLGEWVLGEACGALARWRAGHPGHGLLLLVGVTARQLAEPGLPAHVARVLDRTGVDPGAVCLEVGPAAPPDERCAQVVAGLRETGVRLALGGFARSFAGLAALGPGGPDVVKVGVPGDVPPTRRGDRALVAAASGVAGAFGVDVLAPVGEPAGLDAVGSGRGPVPDWGVPAGRR